MLPQRATERATRELPQRSDRASGHGMLPQRSDRASGHGMLPQRSDAASGHGMLPQAGRRGGRTQYTGAGDTGCCRTERADTGCCRSGAGGHGMLPQRSGRTRGAAQRSGRTRDAAHGAADTGCCAAERADTGCCARSGRTRLPGRADTGCCRSGAGGGHGMTWALYGVGASCWGLHPRGVGLLVIACRHPASRGSDPAISTASGAPFDPAGAGLSQARRADQAGVGGVVVGLHRRQGGPGRVAPPAHCL